MFVTWKHPSQIKEFGPFGCETVMQGHRVGEMTLFFGGRHAHAEYYYRDELGSLRSLGGNGFVWMWIDAWPCS